MTAVATIQDATRHLLPSERITLREWVIEFCDDDEWDLQIEADSKSGKLDHVVAEVEADIAAGRTTEIKCAT